MQRLCMLSRYVAQTWSRPEPDTNPVSVFPEGPEAIKGQELGGEYFEAAGPVIEKQVARAGYRMAAWLDAIADEYQQRTGGESLDEL